ncbi:foldase protein PrsA [Massilia glaciei]|nr:peptidylprolyl isomerase [Massilia glaciei]
MKSRILLLSAASVLALSACNAKETAKPATPATDSTAAASTAVAATVDGVAIPQSTVDLMVKERTAQGQPDTPELRAAIIENLSMQMLVAAEAVKKGIDKAPETVRQMDMVKQSVLANAFVQDYIKNSPITDAMIDAEYKKMSEKAGGNEFKARHILVKTEAEAKSIIASITKDIKAFEKLAKAKSMDPGSKANGGDLGWFNPSGMVPEFGAAVAKLEKGKFTTEPVKTQYGYHVIVLDDSRPITPPPLEQVKEQIKQQLLREHMTKFFADLKAKAKIVVTGAPAPAPAAAAAADAASVAADAAAVSSSAASAAASAAAEAVPAK